MSEATRPNPVPVTAEERSRPVYRLLARAAILLARRHSNPPEPENPIPDNSGCEEGNHA